MDCRVKLGNDEICGLRDDDEDRMASIEEIAC